MKKKMVYIGMGYVGIPCAALFADVGEFNVIGIQRKSKRSGWKIECLNNGKNPFEGDEPGLAELIKKVHTKGTFRVTDDFSECKDADYILIGVQTPTNEQHIPLYESLREVTKQVSNFLRKGVLIILESTVAPGTTEHVVKQILEEGSGLVAGKDFGLAFSYERVMPGRLIEYIVNFPRVVGGIDEESTTKSMDLYQHIVKEKITPTNIITAELAKTIENAYRDVNIAFANEVALACESMGVNVFEIRDLINARKDRNMHIPGAGVGGHCLPKDSWLLAYGTNTYGWKKNKLELISIARRINDYMPNHIVELTSIALKSAGRKVYNAKIVVAGISYLENSDDTRNTPAKPIISLLKTIGADVVAHDPYVKDFDEIPIHRDIYNLLSNSDVLIIVTKHKQYYSLKLKEIYKSMRTPILIDGRNVYKANECRKIGFTYFGVGKGD